MEKDRGRGKGGRVWRRTGEEVRRKGMEKDRGRGKGGKVWRSR